MKGIENNGMGKGLQGWAQLPEIALEYGGCVDKTRIWDKCKKEYDFLVLDFLVMTRAQQGNIHDKKRKEKQAAGSL